jgi:hypothetical protein
MDVLQWPESFSFNQMTSAGSRPHLQTEIHLTGIRLVFELRQCGRVINNRITT